MFSMIHCFAVFQYQVILETACDFGSCDGDKHETFNPGSLHLEMKVNNGKIARLILTDK